jgi:GTP-binding protein
VRIRAEFETSIAGPAGYPGDGLAELALVGRSNVGKSTLVNALTGLKLARTSAAPGKTRLINVYRVMLETGPPFHLVDLPGYGYARAPRHRRSGGGSAESRRDEAREAFEVLTREYFDDRAGRARQRPERRSPAGFATLLLVDGRHPGLENDLGAHGWLSALGAPMGVVATKMDKLTRAERSRAQHAFERAFLGPVLPVSAATGEGLKELWILIARLLSSHPPPPTHPRSSS